MTRPSVPSPGPSPFDGGDDPVLRGLLHEAVADVDPAPRLDEVLARAHDRPRRTTWPVLLVAAATLAAVAVGVGLWLPRTDDAPPAAPPTAAPTDTDSPTVTVADRANVPVYYLGGDDDPRLFREFPFVDAHGSLDLPSLAVEAMLTLAPTDPDYRSPWPEGTTGEVTYVDDPGSWEVVLANPDVDLTRRPAALSPREAELAVQQLLYTVQAAAGDAERHPVTVRVDDSSTVLGLALDTPVRQEPMRSALAPVWIVEPVDGSELRRVEVSGVINQPLPFVVWTVTDAAGTDVASGRAAVTERQTGATYSFTVGGLPSGTYTVTVTRGRAPLGRGSGTGVAADLVDTKEVTVP